MFPGKVFAAGRSLEKAEAFSRTMAGKVQPMRLDIMESVDPDVLRDVKIVVMCLDQKDVTFVRTCLQQGIHYVDISANIDFLSQVEKLDAEAVSGKAAALLSVGLTPGFSNLMALEASRQMDQTDTIDIAVMLGLGDKHGKAAIEWTLNNISKDFQVMRNGTKLSVASFRDGKVFDFGSDLGRKKAYRFNFSDQHTLPRSMGTPSVKTRLCFDSSFATYLFAMLKAIGIFRLLRFGTIRHAAAEAFGKLKMGSDRFALKVEAYGKKDGRSVKAEVFLQGRMEADMTARVAAAVTKALYESDVPHGVHHIEQLFDLGIMPSSIRERVIREIQITQN
ncbi:saccharopine dehydrogenase-like NADP-dependent oxidoreductase [Anaerosolibacter carboniphilus]|uniref:Saccharopine dehydrogenase-like NADP-dependent oxidoreductase n=2 Tax=Anaerosolibacter carboniphilus TaxID=1417629 RepID=A0A841KTC6_9FIRM|nr:saccharopine dehydrogenase-like NADP-dependent oxidoreductase [Anaerosolibacter carboniphilus]